MVSAPDQKQARAVMRYASGLLNDNAMLSHMVLRENSGQIELSNRTVPRSPPRHTDLSGVIRWPRASAMKSLSGMLTGHRLTAKSLRPNGQPWRRLGQADGLVIAMSIKHRERIDLGRDNDPPDRFLILLRFGSAKTVGGMGRMVYRGVERVRSWLIMTMFANTLARLHRLLAA